MIQFPEGYFEDEVRCDFKVTAIMKSCWAATLEVYREIREICDRHGLVVYAAFGTLLGAVRHKGFIPWDDDMDIAMPRNDYMKFLEVAPAELPEGYYIDSVYTDEKYEGNFSKVFNSSVMDFDPVRLNKFHRFPFIVAIDVYPIDNAPFDEKIYSDQTYTLDLIRDEAVLNKLLEDKKSYEKLTAQNKSYYKELKKETYKVLKQRTNFAYAEQDNKCHELALWFENQASKYKSQEKERFAFHQMHHKRNDQVWSAEAFEPLEVPFECITITIPKDYDAILRTIYGDYLTPVQNTAHHDYPYFKAQIQIYIDYLESKKETETVNSNK